MDAESTEEDKAVSDESRYLETIEMDTGASFDYCLFSGSLGTNFSGTSLFVLTLHIPLSTQRVSL